MILVDFKNIIVLVLVIGFFVIMNIVGFAKKNAWYAMTTTIVNIVLLILHFLLAKYMTKPVLRFNVYTDLICLAVNIPLLVIVDEIETRRHVIKSVFENKYKTKK